MKKSILILSILISGCTTVRYKDATSEFEGASYFTFAEVDKLVVNIDGEKRVLKLQGASMDQTQTLEAVAGAVTKAAIQATVP